jgi:hypothetical protein
MKGYYNGSELILDNIHTPGKIGTNPGKRQPEELPE